MRFGKRPQKWRTPIASAVFFRIARFRSHGSPFYLPLYLVFLPFYLVFFASFLLFIYICAYIYLFLPSFLSCLLQLSRGTLQHRLVPARRPLGALSFLPFHSSLPSLSLSRGTLQRRSTPARRSERRSAPARFPLGALSFLSFHHSILSFSPSLWLSRSTLQRRSAPARRPKLPSFPFLPSFLPCLLFRCPWHAAAPLGARSAP